MSNISISKKLILTFGVMILLFAGFSFFSVQSAKNIGTEVRNIGDWMESRDRVANISESVNGVHRSMMYRVVTNDANSKWKSAFNEYIREVDDAFLKYEETLKETEYEDPEEKEHDFELLERERKLWKTYHKEIQKADAMLSSSNAVGAIQILEGSAAEAFDGINRAMADDAKECAVGTADALEQGEDAYMGLERMAVIASVLIIALCVIVLIILIKNIKSAASVIVSISKKAANGDLSKNIDLETDDEFGEIARHFNDMLDNTRSILLRVQGTAVEVANGSENLTTNANQSAQATQNVAEAITNVSGATAMQMDELDATEREANTLKSGMESVNKAVNSGMESVLEAVRQANEGNELARSTVEQMNHIADTVASSAETVTRLGKSSEEIGSIVETISSIANQTNLLALNAAIESARAGEAGRGFSVVAEEVRKLAEESKKAAEQIGERIRGIQETTEQAVIAMDTGRKTVEEGKENVNATGEFFTQIVKTVGIVKDSTQSIKDTVEGLSDPVAKIVEMGASAAQKAKSIAGEAQGVSAATQEQAAGMNEIANASRNLAGLAEEMQDSVKRFRLE